MPPEAPKCTSKHPNTTNFLGGMPPDSLGVVDSVDLCPDNSGNRATPLSLHMDTLIRGTVRDRRLVIASWLVVGGILTNRHTSTSFILVPTNVFGAS